MAKKARAWHYRDALFEIIKVMQPVTIGSLTDALNVELGLKDGRGSTAFTPQQVAHALVPLVRDCLIVRSITACSDLTHQTATSIYAIS